MQTSVLGAIARFVGRNTGWQVVRGLHAPGGLPEASPADLETIEAVRELTMTSPERLWALINAVRYVARSGLAGDFVECGVWRGGSAMAAARSFLQENAADRDLWLYDTFSGMTAPTERDRTASDGVAAQARWARGQRADGENDWCRASLEDVRKNLRRTEFPEARIHYIQGPVEKTLREEKNLPKSISILRLDTDWYESTRAELEVLYPRLAKEGVLIIDDYGYWEGSRKAVDEFFAKESAPVLLNRIDDTGRIAIKR